MELLAAAEGPAARDDDLGAGQLGSLAFRSLESDEAAEAGIASGIGRLDRGAAALARSFLETGAADRDHLLRVVRLDRGDGIAGVDRADEGARILDADDVADLHHVEQGRDARGDVLAESRGRSDEGVVALHQLDRDRRDIFRQVMIDVRRVGDEHLGDAGDLRRFVGDRTDVRSGDQRVHFAKLRRGGDRGER